MKSKADEQQYPVTLTLSVNISRRTVDRAKTYIAACACVLTTFWPVWVVTAPFWAATSPTRAVTACNPWSAARPFGRAAAPPHGWGGVRPRPATVADL